MYYHFPILLIEISTLLQFLISFTDGKIFIKKSSLYILKHSPRHNNNNFYALKPQVAKNALTPYWKFCAMEGNLCNCIGKVRFQYEKGGGTVYYRDSNSSVMCKYEIFGDPYPYHRKTCSCHKKSSNEEIKGIIYSINLDKRKDRWDEMKKTFYIEHFKLHRISAVDGKLLNLATVDPKIVELKYDSTENAKYDKRLKPHVSMTLSPGEIACSLSHYKIWKKKELLSIVIEDDVKLNKNFNINIFNKYIQQVQDNPEIEILYLGGLEMQQKGVKSRAKYTKGIDAVDGFVWGSFAYIITQKGKTKLLNALPIKGPTDLFLGLTLKDKFRVRPWIIDHDNRYDTNINHDSTQLRL